MQTKKALRDYQNTALAPTKEADWQAIGRKKPALCPGRAHSLTLPDS
jgi:hypothetical protein